MAEPIGVMYEKITRSREALKEAHFRFSSLVIYLPEVPLRKIFLFAYFDELTNQKRSFLMSLGFRNQVFVRNFGLLRGHINGNEWLVHWLVEGLPHQNRLL